MAGARSTVSVATELVTLPTALVFTPSFTIALRTKKWRIPVPFLLGVTDGMASIEVDASATAAAMSRIFFAFIGKMISDGP